MGNYDIIVKTEEIRKKVEEGDLLSAQNILDAIDTKKVKNISDLSLMAEVFKENERYDEAAELYLKIYERTKTRKTTSQMVNISIKRNKIEEAEEYYEKYLKLAEGDFDSFVFRYKLDKIKGASYEQLIQTLQALKKIDYTEKWAYELAKLYYKAGMEEECTKECSDIILWFGEGVYVEKAKMLRSYFSGETNKERMMEQLLRKVDSSSDSTSQNQGIDIEHSRENTQTTDTGNQEENIGIKSDFTVEKETEELEDVLKKDIKTIMTDENIVDLQETFEVLQVKEDSTGEEAALEEDTILSNIAKEYNINPEEIFGEFLKEIAIKKQLVSSLANILRQEPILILITGKEGVGKTTLAKDLALFMSKTSRIQSSKVAKISAQKLNAVDLEAKRDTLKSCCLLIDQASELSPTAIDSLLELSRDLQGDFAVIFEENTINYNKLLSKGNNLAEVIKSKIQLS